MRINAVIKNAKRVLLLVTNHSDSRWELLSHANNWNSFGDSREMFSLILKHI